MRIRRAPLALVAASLLLAGCGSMVRGSWPGFTDSPLIADAAIRVSPGYTLTVEKIVFSAAGAALLYTLYDPLAPNWTIEEEAVGEDRYRLTLTMKRFIIGGEGEALAVLRRWAEAIQYEGQYDDYRIERFEQGIESNTPIARRYAHATVRMTRKPHPELPAVYIARDEPPAMIDLRRAPEPGTPGATVAPDGAQPTAGTETLAVAAPLPKPPPRVGADLGLDAGGEVATAGPSASPADAEGALSPESIARLPRPAPAGASQVVLNARVLFDFDSARLSAAGRAALERELVARRDELGRLAVVLVSGHTDRIGSYEYNQRLSEARARAVRSFLVARGFDGQRVASVGYGKTRPLAGFPCDETLPRGPLVECLAPQRRVELDIREAE